MKDLATYHDENRLIHETDRRLHAADMELSGGYIQVVPAVAKKLAAFVQEGALARISHQTAKRGRGDVRASACFASLVCIRKANASQGAQGEPDTDEVPVALRPKQTKCRRHFVSGERASHGWLARPTSEAGTAKRSGYP